MFPADVDMPERVAVITIFITVAGRGVFGGHLKIEITMTVHSVTQTVPDRSLTRGKVAGSEKGDRTKD